MPLCLAHFFVICLYTHPLFLLWDSIACSPCSGLEPKGLLSQPLLPRNFFFLVRNIFLIAWEECLGLLIFHLSSYSMWFETQSLLLKVSKKLRLSAILPAWKEGSAANNHMSLETYSSLIDSLMRIKFSSISSLQPRRGPIKHILIVLDYRNYRIISMYDIKIFDNTIMLH